MRTRHILVLAAITCLFVGGPAGSRQPDRPNETTKDQQELHLVSIYEGYCKTGEQIHGPKAVVIVNRPGKQITLVLTSHGPVTWEILPQDKTQIVKVILGGNPQQAVAGLPADTPITEAVQGKSKKPLSYSYRIDSSSFRALVRRLAKHSEMPLASFHGVYHPESGVPFMLDKVQDDARLSADYPRPTPLADLPKLEFKGHYYTPAKYGHADAAYGDYTLGGPVEDTLKPLPKGVRRLVHDFKNKKYFGIADGKLAELDLEKRTTTPIEPGLDVPPISGIADVTYDGKRERLILIAGAFIYTYTPATKKWLALADRPREMMGLAYSSSADRLYGLTFERGEDGHGRPVLCELNANGAMTRTTPLHDPIVPGTVHPHGGQPIELVMVGDHVVLLTSPGGTGEEDGRGSDGWYTYLIEPKEGKVTLTAKVLRR